MLTNSSIKWPSQWMLPLLGLFLLVAMQISFGQTGPENMVIIVLGAGLLLWNQQWGALAVALLLPLLAVVGTISAIFWNHQTDQLVNLISRYYAFTMMSVLMIATLDWNVILKTLGEYGLPDVFVYGLMTVLNATASLVAEVKNIRDAMRLRQLRWPLLQPIFYLKLIMLALHWRDRLTTVMHLRGFDETLVRTHVPLAKMSWRQVAVVGLVWLGLMGVNFI